jgi:hypothetical protein
MYGCVVGHFDAFGYGCCAGGLLIEGNKNFASCSEPAFYVFDFMQIRIGVVEGFDCAAPKLHGRLC